MSRKLSLVILFSIILFLILVVGVTRLKFDFGRVKVNIDASQPKFEQVGPYVTASQIAGQNFVSERNGLSRIIIFLPSSSEEVAAQVANTPITLTLTQGESRGKVILTETTAPQNIIRRNYLIYDFPPITNSAGKSYYFYLLVKEEAISLPLLSTTNDTYLSGQAFLDHEPIEGDLAFQTYTSVSEDDLIFLTKALVRNVKSDLAFFSFYGLIIIISVGAYFSLSFRSNKNGKT